MTVVVFLHGRAAWRAMEAMRNSEGFDTVGFLVESENDSTQRDFIVWITTGSGPKRSLERRVFKMSTISF